MVLHSMSFSQQVKKGLKSCLPNILDQKLRLPTKMKILIACEYSGITRDAFKRFGWDAWSCDLEPTDLPGQHYQCDVREVLDKGWDMMIAHPPCTYLTNSGNNHFNDFNNDGRALAAVSGQDRYREMIEAVQFFKLFQEAPIKHKCIENPIPFPAARHLIGDYSQVVHPWQFGHPWKKPTCYWLTNLPHLQPTMIVKQRKAWVDQIGGKDRQKKRAKTFSEIADAMAAQWTLAYLEALPIQ